MTSRLEQFHLLHHGQLPDPKTPFKATCHSCHNPANIPLSNQFVCTGQGNDPYLYLQRGGNAEVNGNGATNGGNGNGNGANGSNGGNGNGAVEAAPGCFQCAKPEFATSTNPCLIRPRHYIQPTTERPSWYFDLTEQCIGGRPVRRAHHVNAIPRTVRFDTVNLGNRTFNCQQPYWANNCL